MEEKVYSLISEHFGIATSEIAPSLEIRKDFNTTDLEIADFFQTLERVFHITITKNDAMQIKTVADIVGFVDEHAEEIT